MAARKGLTAKQIERIRAMREAGKTLNQIAMKFGISINNVVYHLNKAA